MIFTRINQIQHTPTRHVARAAVRAHLIFLKLVLLKTLIFNIVGLKTLVVQSALLMGIFHFIPHIDVVDAATPQSIDMSVSDTVYPVVTDTDEINVYMIYAQSETPSGSPSNVVVTATIPAGETFDSASVTPTSISPTLVTWNLPPENNTHVMILLRLLVDPDANGTVTSTATVTANNPDPYTSNNTASASIIVGNDGAVLADADLYITKQVDHAQASVTDELTYTINYGNQGTDTANHTVIYDVVPSNMYVVSASPEPTGTTGANGSVLVWDVGNLPGGMQGDITLTVSLYPLLSEGTIVQNNVVIDSDIYESDFDNNVASANTQIVEGDPELFVSIFTPDTTVCSGDTVPFVVNFGNQGDAEANSVTIINQIPAALQYLYSSEPYASVSGARFTRNIAGQLFPGDQGSFTVTTKAVSAGVGVTNIVIANQQGTPVATGTFQIDVLTPEVCDYLGGGGGDGGGDPVPGCMDPAANNYNAAATQSNGSCTYSTGNRVADPDPTPTPDGGDYYIVQTDPASPIINKAIDLTVGLGNIPVNKTSETRALVLELQKKSGTKWSVASASDYTLSIPTVSATFLKSADWLKKWKGALTVKKSGYYRVKVATADVIGYAYLTIGDTITNPNGTGNGTGGGNTGNNNPYLTGTNIWTGGTGDIPNTWKPIGDPTTNPTNTLPKATPPTSIPKTTRPATAPKRPVDPSNPFVRRNPGTITAAERRNQEELRNAIKRATSTYTSAPVTCEDGYREEYEWAKLIKITSARSLEDFAPCAPILRVDAIKTLVLDVLDLQLVEPNLNSQANYTDTADLSNEQSFYVELAVDLRLINGGTTTFRPYDHLKIQEAALAIANFIFGTEYIKSKDTQFDDAMRLLDQAKLMRYTDKGTEDITKGDLYRILYRSYFGEVPRASRYIRMLPNASKK